MLCRLFTADYEKRNMALYLFIIKRETNKYVKQYKRQVLRLDYMTSDKQQT